MNDAIQLSPLLQKSYPERGFVIIPHIFTTTALATLRNSFRTVLEDAGADRAVADCDLDQLILRREAENHGLVYGASQSVGSSVATYELVGGSGVFDAICKVADCAKSELHLMPMYLIVQLPSDERFDYPWHQDGAYYPWCKKFLTLWFPINRGTKRDTGTISLIPGSHREGLREADTFLKHGYFKQIQSKLGPNEEAQEFPLEMQLGDCCVMNGNTVHRSVANHSNTPRIAAVLRIANIAGQSYDRERFYCVHKSVAHGPGAETASP